MRAADHTAAYAKASARHLPLAAPKPAGQDGRSPLQNSQERQRPTLPGAQEQACSEPPIAGKLALLLFLPP